MIYFRQQRIKIDSQEEIEKRLNQSASKVLSMFDLTATSMYVILEERPFVGQKLDNGETIISRYRHTIFQIVPRIVSKWKVDSINGELFLVVSNRLGLLPTLVLFVVMFPLIVEIIRSVATFEVPNLETVAYSLGFLAIFLLLTKFELRLTDKTILKVINNEKVKSLVTV
jgi:hypothetical protein